MSFFAYPYPDQLLSLLQTVTQTIPLLKSFEESKVGLYLESERKYDTYLLQQLVLITNAIGMKTFMRDTQNFKQAEFNTQVEALLKLANEVIASSQAYKRGERTLIQLPQIEDKT